MATEKIPIPGPIECTGNVYHNWTYFKEQWGNYEIATRLDERTEMVRLSTFKAVIGKDCYTILKLTSRFSRRGQGEDKLYNWCTGGVFQL